MSTVVMPPLALPTDLAATDRTAMPAGVNPDERAKRMHAVAISQEKDAMATNYMAFYGFMNLLAAGLLFYIARS
jgi:hypothetical protein